MTTMQPTPTLYDGNHILAFYPMTTPIVPEQDAGIPLTAGAVVVRHTDQFLLVHNLKRNQWESVSGGIEPGETPEQATIREVIEESGQRITDIACLGLIKFYIRRTDAVEFFAFYVASLDGLTPFSPNSETDRITLWRPGEPLDNKHGMLSRWMIKKVLGGNIV
jgi:8-oxo-dGTP pyrophosphatase MutT (NUDIX family)